MRVWVLWYDAGFVRGVLDVAADAGLQSSMRAAGTALRKTYDVAGEFRKVEQAEPYYRQDERVYRCGWLTLVARPFELEIAA